MDQTTEDKLNDLLSQATMELFNDKVGPFWDWCHALVPGFPPFVFTGKTLAECKALVQAQVNEISWPDGDSK